MVALYLIPLVSCTITHLPTSKLWAGQLSAVYDFDSILFVATEQTWVPHLITFEMNWNSITGESTPIIYVGYTDTPRISNPTWMKFPACALNLYMYDSDINPLYFPYHSDYTRIKLSFDRKTLLSTSQPSHVRFPLVHTRFFFDDEFARFTASRLYHETGKRAKELYSIDPAPLLFPNNRKPDYLPPRIAIPSPVMRGDLTVIQPGHRDWDKYVLDRTREQYLHLAKYDIAFNPADQQTLRLFHSYQGKIHSSIITDQTAKRPKKVIDRQFREGEIPAGFDSQFSIYTIQGIDYLLTRSGKLAIVEPKGKSDLVIKPIWNDPHRPLLGVLHDQQNEEPKRDRGFAFGFADEKGSSSNKRFYIEFEPQPKAIEYQLKTRLMHKHSDAYREVQNLIFTYKAKSKEKVGDPLKDKK